GARRERRAESGVAAAREAPILPQRLDLDRRELGREPLDRAVARAVVHHPEPHLPALRAPAAPERREQSPGVRETVPVEHHHLDALHPAWISAATAARRRASPSTASASRAAAAASGATGVKPA